MGGRRILAAALAAAAAAGCGDGGGPATATDPAATVTPAATPEPAVTAPRGRPLRFRAADGTRLRGTFVPARGRAPGIVLSHGWRNRPAQFAELVAILHEAGYASLRYTSRDRGSLDETILADDVVGAVRALRRLPEVDPDRIALIGNSIGGSAAAWVMGTRRPAGVRTAIGLSAPEGAPMIHAGTEGRFRPRDLLLITDERESINAENITKDAGGRGVTTWVSPVAGHGVVLVPEPAVRKRILSWLRAHLVRPGGGGARVGGQAETGVARP